MDIFISVVTNAAFLTVFTLIVRELFKRGLQKQKGQIDSTLQTQKGNIDKELEKIKNDLQLDLSAKQEKLNQKRAVYINLIDSMTVFIGGRVEDEKRSEYIKKFLKDLDIVWLWGSDDVIKALSIFLKINQGLMPGNLHEAFANVVIEMRKDIGFETTTVNSTDYVYIKP